MIEYTDFEAYDLPTLTAELNAAIGKKGVAWTWQGTNRSRIKLELLAGYENQEQAARDVIEAHISADGKLARDRTLWANRAKELAVELVSDNYTLAELIMAVVDKASNKGWNLYDTLDTKISTLRQNVITLMQDINAASQSQLKQLTDAYILSQLKQGLSI